MDREVKYKVVFGSEPSGLQQANTALRQLRSATEETMDTMASRSSYAIQGFRGIEMAARGDTVAVMGVARAFKALWEVFSSGSPVLRILTLVSMGIALIGAAYQKVKAHQENQTKLMNESAEASDRFQQSLRQLHAARGALNLNAEAESLERLTKSFARATQAAQSLADAEDKLGAEKHKIEIAGIDEREAKALMSAGGDKRQEANIKFNAAREKRAVEYTYTTDTQEKERARILERMAAIKAVMNELTAQSIGAKAWGDFSPNLEKSRQKVARLTEELRTLGVGKGGAATDEAGPDRDKWLAKRTELEAALNEQKALQDSNAKLKTSIDDQLAAREQEMQALENQQRLLDQQRNSLNAQYDADVAQINLEEQAARKAIDAENVMLATAQKRQAVERAIAAARTQAKQLVEESAGDDAESVSSLQEELAARKAQYEHQYKMATDTAYRREHVDRMDQAVTKTQAKEQTDWEKRVAKAEDAQRRGARGKWITDTLTARDTGRQVMDLKKELELAQQNQATNIAKSTEYLKSIANDLQKTLSTS